MWLKKKKRKEKSPLSFSFHLSLIEDQPMPLEHQWCSLRGFGSTYRKPRDDSDACVAPGRGQSSGCLGRETPASCKQAS